MKPDPNAPHSLVVKAQNREALKVALQKQIEKVTKGLISHAKT